MSHSDLSESERPLVVQLCKGQKGTFMLVQERAMHGQVASGVKEFGARSLALKDVLSALQGTGRQ